MQEQTEHQNKKFLEIKKRACIIRKQYEEQQKKNDHEIFTNVPQTYVQG